MNIFAIAIAVISLVAARPAFATDANDLCSGNPCVISGAHTVDPDSILEFGATTAVELSSSAKIKIGSAGELVSRRITWNAASLTMRSGAEIDGDGPLAQVFFNAGAGSISIESGATIDVHDNIAGNITLNATGDVNVAGTVNLSASQLDAQGGSFRIAAGGAAMLSGKILASATGSGAGGGDVSVLAGGDISISSEITTKGGEFGGGAIDFESNSGNIVFTGDIETSGGPPDGEAGSIDFLAFLGSVDILGGMDGRGGSGADEACGDGAPLLINASGDIDLRSELRFIGGKHCFGGEVDISTSANFTMHSGSSMLLTAGGAYGSGGGLTVSATGNATLTDADLTSPGGGGTVEVISGLTTEILGEIDAQGTSGDGFGGNILLQGCIVNVAASAELDTRAGFTYPGLGINEIRASGAMTVAGLVRASYENRFHYKTVTPVLSGTITPSAVLTENLDLPDCESACGDGTIDEGEVCDDGNLRGCDGCSSDCSRIDNICGDGLLECNEICDDGNMDDGDGCEATCAPTGVSGVRIPGRKAANGCLVEWDLTIANPAINSFTGSIDSDQECIDGDPRCDADNEVDGRCTWDIATCVMVDNPDLASCNSGAIQFLKLRKPRYAYGSDAVNIANADTIASALMALGGTVKAGTQTLQSGPSLSTPGACTERYEFHVPVGSRGQTTKPLSIGARDDAGHILVGNKINLTCLHNDAICGNGEVQIGERCDDGNRDSCDGCSSTCRIEECGNGTLECGEQCDEGDANGTDESRCSSSCQITPSDVRIPGGGSKKTDCVAEWVVETSAAGIPTSKSGLPKPLALCRAGDPSCDFDLEKSGCQFRVWGCFGAADSRLGCTAQVPASIELRRPSARARKITDRRARSVLTEGLSGLALGAPGTESCTGVMLVDIPSGEKLRMSTRTGIAGAKKKDGDRLKLQCLSN
ncbi:MAG: DUF4215 domain-containing protein [Deltaproteobacteria bacterium]